MRLCFSYKNYPVDKQAKEQITLMRKKKKMKPTEQKKKKEKNVSPPK